MAASSDPSSTQPPVTFRTVKKGYDPDEVRARLRELTLALEDARRQQEDLREALASAQLRAEHPVLDEPTLISALGQQSAAVLRAAHEEAAKVAQRAEEEANALVRDAQRQLSEATIAAEALAAERIAAAEFNAAAISAETTKDAKGALELARAEGEELVERARLHGIAIVERAQETRRQILEDLASRRQEMAEQILALRQARDAIARSIITARQSFDRIVDDLGAPESSAKGSQESVMLEAGIPALVSEIIEEIPFSPTTLREVSPPPPSQQRRPRYEEKARNLEQNLSHSRPLINTRQDLTHTEMVVEDVSPRPTESDVSTKTTPSPLRQESETENRFVPHGVNSFDGEEEETDEEPLHATSHLADDDDEDDEDDELSTRSLQQAPRRSATADDLFGRLRAGRGEESLNTPVRINSAPVSTTASERPRKSESSDGAFSSGAQSRRDQNRELGDAPAGFLARSERLEDVLETMLRRMKRALQDDQNLLLDRLRQHPGGWSDELAAANDEQRSIYSDGAYESLVNAFRSGVAFSSTKEITAVSSSDPAKVIEGLVESLVEAVVSTLRRRLAGSDVADAAERINAAYREWRGERIETLCQDRILEAFHVGVRDGAKDAKGFRWLPSPVGEGCADCDDNALAEVVGVSEAFPTGHLQPPAHPGCRCLLVATR